MEDGSHEPFLEKKAQHWDHHNSNTLCSGTDDRHFHDPLENPPVRWCSIRAVAAHVLVLILYTAVYIGYIMFTEHHGKSSSMLTYSPAAGAIRYTVKTVDGLHTDSIFAGTPNAESDLAWHDLLSGINLRITAKEMNRLNQESLALADGSGYLGTLGVYHELHCIKRIRKWFYKDYYYPNETVFEKLEHQTHAAHCLELLRQSAVCKGDISVTAFKWLKQGSLIEPTTREGTPHQCVDWDRLSGWAKARSVDLFDPELLVKPHSA